MSGTIRFDDEHIVKFTLDAENMIIYLTALVGTDTYNFDVPLEDGGGDDVG